MDLNIGDRVFYTRSNGLRPLATVVGTAEDGLLHLGLHERLDNVLAGALDVEGVDLSISGQGGGCHQNVVVAAELLLGDEINV